MFASETKEPVASQMLMLALTGSPENASVTVPVITPPRSSAKSMPVVLVLTATATGVAASGSHPPNRAPSGQGRPS